VGVGQTRHGKRDDVNWVELVYEAVGRALEDVEITLKEVDAVVCGNMPPFVEGTDNVHLWWADGLGAYLKPLMRVATCGSTGISIAHSAYYHVASGLFDVVLAVGTEKMHEGAGAAQGAMTAIWDPRYERAFLVGALGITALQAQNYVARYGVKEEQAARVAVKNHANALNNPYAHVRTRVTVEDVLRSRVVCYPLKLLHCCPVSDGACAVIMASEEKARKLTDNPAWVRGVGYFGDEEYLSDKDIVDWASAKMAARTAYRMAGVDNPRKQLDVAEVYNPFTYMELLFYELFDFCGKGEGGRLIDEGVTGMDGDLPVTPSGGVLCTNPIGASALIRVAEAALQVMGKAGRRQVSNVETALAHGWGGALQFNGVMVLGREP